jgi:hypothetical protein
MIGFSVAIRRKDGSMFFATPKEGFATPVWFMHGQALKHAKECREHGSDAIVVRVEYQDPSVVGPKRYIGELS